MDPNGHPSHLAGLVVRELEDTTRRWVPRKPRRRLDSLGHRWLTPGLTRIIRKAWVAWRKWKASGLEADREAAQRLRRKKRGAVRAAKDGWVDWTVERALKDGRSAEIPKLLAGTQKKGIPPLRSGGHYLTKDHDKAELMKTTFESKFSPAAEGKEWSPIPGVQREWEQVNVAEVRASLKKMKARSAPGEDGVEARILRKLGWEMADSLCILFNSTLRFQLVPDAWRSGVVVPVEKVAGTDDPDCFRPITLLSVLGKLWEGVMLQKLSPFSELSREQYGFSAKSSCGDAHLRLQEAIGAAAASQSRVSVAVACLDARRAFDSVSHAVVLERLMERGVPPHLINALASWLLGRTFRVRCGTTLSSEGSVPSGVPQGSRLGPLLFCFVIDPIFRLQLHPSTHLQAFADDVVLTGPASTPEEVARLEEDIVKVEAFLETVGLKINGQKTQLLEVKLRQEVVVEGAELWGELAFPPPDQARGFQGLRVAGVWVGVSPVVRYLGVSYDSHLNFQAHWARVTGAGRGTLASMSRLLGRHRSALRIAALTRVTSLLLFSLPFTPPSTRRGALAVASLQRRTARTIANRWDRDEDVPALMDRLGVPSFTHLLFLHSMRFMWTCMFAGRRWGDRLRRCEPRRAGLRSRQEDAVVWRVEELPIARASFQRLQPWVLRSMWNNLPFSKAGLDRKAECQTLERFTEALPKLLPHLTPAQLDMLHSPAIAPIP
jgi:hypothetical protein